MSQYRSKNFEDNILYKNMNYHVTSKGTTASKIQNYCAVVTILIVNYWLLTATWHGNSATQNRIRKTEQEKNHY
jgi:hypothetical protein